MTTKFQELNASLYEVLEHFKKNTTVSYHYMMDGTEMILSHRPLSGSQWYLCTTVEKKEAYTLAKKIAMGVADTQIQFMSTTINDFKEYFKPSITKLPFDVNDAVDRAVKLMKSQLNQGWMQLLQESLTNTLELKDFHFSLWQW